MLDINVILDNNFGEIEMCLNEHLTFDIKIKTNTCDLFILKKNVYICYIIM